MTKIEREQLVCRDKLDTLEQAESLSTEDRFSSTEKNRLLEAYNQHGFQVFQDMRLLQQFFPDRSEINLKGLLNRLKTRLQQEGAPSGGDYDDKSDNLSQWQRLCVSLMGNFARDKRVNLDDALADALMQTALERELDEQHQGRTINKEACDGSQPNYPELIKSFAQLLAGKFPDNMTPANARISMRLFEHINGLVDSIDLQQISKEFEQATWLVTSTDERRSRQDMALKGLAEVERLMKNGPTLRDLKTSKNLEALCLELPKIKRITELLNPLQINESLVNYLIDT